MEKGREMQENKPTCRKQKMVKSNSKTSQRTKSEKKTHIQKTEKLKMPSEEENVMMKSIAQLPKKENE